MAVSERLLRSGKCGLRPGRTSAWLLSAVSVWVAFAAAGCQPASRPPTVSATPQTTATAQPLPTQLPATSFVVDLTWIDDHDGWALAAAPCGTDSYCPRLARTSDGGQTWEQLPNPPGTLQSGCLPGDCVSYIRFASATIGYLFGPAFYTTGDGGLTWRAGVEDLPVEAVEPGAGNVLRIVDNRIGCPGPCDRTVEAAVIGSSNWHPLLALPFASIPTRQISAKVIRQGSQVIYVPIFGDPGAGGGTQQAILFRSTDAGATWQQLTDPCGGSGATLKDAGDFAAGPGGFLVALRNPRAGAPPSFITTSSDRGSSWSQLRMLPGAAQNVAAASSSHLVATSGSTVGSGAATFMAWVSTDAGRNWQVAVADPEQLDPTTPPRTFLGFEDTLVGRWVGYPRAIWTTTDAGVHWVRRPSM